MPVAYTQNTYSVCLEVGRLESFKNWPHDETCSKENMAKAGFAYSGHPDQVQCFVCQIKLNDWDPSNDDPWVKHREFSPGCLFAQLGKEESSLTVEQWCDVNNSRVVHMLDNKFNKLIDHKLRPFSQAS